jgi:hypothetical protein
MSPLVEVHEEKRQKQDAGSVYFRETMKEERRTMNERPSLSVIRHQLFKSIFSSLCDNHRQRTTDN